MRAGRRGTGMNDKKTKEVDGRESVSMLPGVTVGVMIAVIAFVLSFDALRLVFVSSGVFRQVGVSCLVMYFFRV